MKVIIILILSSLIFFSCISIGENLSSYKNIQKFKHGNYTFEKINSESIKLFPVQKLFIIKYYKFDCNSHRDLLKKTFELYKTKQENYKLVIIFVDRAIALKTQLKFLQEFTNETELFYLDLDKYQKGNLHKKYDLFLNEISTECLQYHLDDFYIIYDKEQKKCIPFN